MTRKYNFYFMGDKNKQFQMNDSTGTNLYVDLEFSKERLSRITRFYNEIPSEIINKLIINNDKHKLIVNIPYKQKINEYVYNTDISVYEVEYFDTKFMLLIKHVKNLNTVLLIIHTFDGFDDLEEKFNNVFDSAIQ